MAKTMAGTDGFINDIKKSICKTVSKKKTTTKSKTSSATKTTPPKTIRVKFEDNPDMQRKYIKMVENFILKYNTGAIPRATKQHNGKIMKSGSFVYAPNYSNDFGGKQPYMIELAIVSSNIKSTINKTNYTEYIIGYGDCDKNGNIVYFFVEDRPEHLEGKNKMFLTAQGLENLKEWYS